VITDKLATTETRLALKEITDKLATTETRLALKEITDKLATTETRLALDLGQKVEGDYRKVGSL
jgi:hypothetical protein